jgi:hypothetical protein
MEFSFELPKFMLNFLNIQDVGIILVFCCAFGILLFSGILAVLMKPFRLTLLYNIFMLPLLLTWPISTIFTVVLYGLDIEPIKIITMIVLIYPLMFICCLLNINLLKKYLLDNRAKMEADL